MIFLSCLYRLFKQTNHTFTLISGAPSNHLSAMHIAGASNNLGIFHSNHALALKQRTFFVYLPIFVGLSQHFSVLFTLKFLIIILSFFHFPPSLFHFSSYFSTFKISPFFLASFSPICHKKFPGGTSGGGHSPTCYAIGILVQK